MRRSVRVAIALIAVTLLLALALYAFVRVSRHTAIPPGGQYLREGLSPALALAPKILVLDNCDGDFRTPPFEDAVIMFAANGEALGRVSGFNLCQTVGGQRALAVTPDGRMFLVNENVGNKLTAYETETGKRLWSLSGRFTSTIVSPNGLIYAVRSGGTIYGKETLILDAQGQILKTVGIGGFDLVLDPDREVLWLVADKIRKCDLQLNVLVELDPIGWCGVSCDVGPDGSLWVAERQHPDVSPSRNRILQITPAGEVRKSRNLELDPRCLRVDRTDGSVWVTGAEYRRAMTDRVLEAVEKRTGPVPLGSGIRKALTRSRVATKTQKFNAEGVLLHRIGVGGHSLEIDRADRSVWLAGTKRVYHYSPDGVKLASFGGVSADQKYVAVVPERRENDKPDAAPNNDPTPSKDVSQARQEVVIGEPSVHKGKTK